MPKDLATVKRYAWINVLVGAVAYFYVLGFPAVLMPTLYPEIIQDTGWSRAAVMSFASFKFMSGAVFSLLVGFIIHRTGSKNILLIAATLKGLALGLFLFVDTLLLYYLLGVVMGIGAIAGSVSIKILVSQWFWHRQGRAVSLTLLGAGLGASASPMVAESMLVYFGWRETIFIVSLGIWVLVIPMILLLMKSQPERFGFDSRALDPGDYRGRFRPSEKLHQTGFRSAVRSRPFLMLAVATLLTGFVDQAISQPTKTYLQLDLGFSGMEAASITSSIIFTSLIARLFFGWLFDRYSIVGVAFCLFIAALSVVSTLYIVGPISLFVFVLLRGMAHGGTLVDIPVLAKHLFGSLTLAQMIGTLTAIYNLGMALGPAFSGWYFDSYGSYFWCFMLCFALQLFAALLLVNLGWRARTGDEPRPVGQEL